MLQKTVIFRSYSGLLVWWSRRTASFTDSPGYEIWHLSLSLVWCSAGIFLLAFGFWFLSREVSEHWDDTDRMKSIPLFIARTGCSDFRFGIHFIHRADHLSLIDSPWSSDAIVFSSEFFHFGLNCVIWTSSKDQFCELFVYELNI
jgi:hypothetical protein